MRIWASAILITLVGCDVAPRTVNFAQTRIETADEAYQIFVDGVLAGLVAERLAEVCPRYDFNERAEAAYQASFEAEFERLFEEDPDVARAFLQRLGVVLPADVDTIEGFENLQVPEFDAGYFAANAGLTFDIGTRAIGSVFRQGIDPTCEDAEREIAQGTLAGSFLQAAQ